MMNYSLNIYQRIWFEEIFKPYVDNNPNKNISYPFFLGVSEKYKQAKNRIMIVGQETRGWSVYKSDWTIVDSQKWTVDYLDYQLQYSNDLRLKQMFGRRNSSPFWGFFKQFRDADIVPCWNNVDKAQRWIGSKTKSLTEEIELEFNRVLPNSKNTLFQMEVQVVKPDVIVFITGPNYRVTMEAALNMERGALTSVNLSHQTTCVDITDIAKLDVPTFWTYHPRHINGEKEISRLDIVNAIRKGFNR